jgi:hypothetical protein
MLDKLRALRRDLDALRKDVSSVNTDRIARVSIRGKAEILGSRWFSDISELLITQHGLSPDLIEGYSQHFGHLIKISAPNNLKKSYVEVLRSILKSLRDDLIIPLQQQPKGQLQTPLLAELLGVLPSASENAYLKEAVDCAHHNYLRASVVLGWCAAIDRIHRVIERNGFAKFNVASSTMASQATGRFKKFNAVQNVASLSELREVFDTLVLWVLEGMGFIDSNQHTRLRSCFDMRCQCAHPGDAPMTQYNLLSYFSDLKEIVFDNPKFEIDEPQHLAEQDGPIA